VAWSDRIRLAYANAKIIPAATKNTSGKTHLDIALTRAA
jgi:hypothetical protein